MSATDTCEVQTDLELRVTKIAAVLTFVLFAANMAHTAWRNSGAGDELGAHIPSGFLYWISGSFSGGIGNFPLGQLWIAFPVWLLGLPYELFTEQHLFLFRLPVMVFGLALVATAYAFARALFGPRAGLATLVLGTLSPSILGHATVATLDLPTAFVVLLVLFLLHRYLEAPGLARVALLALALAAALTIKVQAMLLLPLVAASLVTMLPKLFTERSSVLKRVLGEWLLIPVVCLIGINLVYLRAPGFGGLLLPELYIAALQTKIAHSAGGHFAYLLGSYSTQGWWHYFPLAILFKTPLATLLLAGIGLARRHSRRVLLLVHLPVSLFLGAAMLSHINIGLRHILMIYPLLLLLAGVGAVRLWEGRRWQRWLLGGLALSLVVQAAWIHPHYLSYFNALAGGSSNGHRILLGSNFDWAQNDRYLAEYVQRSGLQYSINPDPFTPTTGPVLVNANALYGILNRGEAAYSWLRHHEPLRQIAYTWFEYDLKGDVPESPKRSDQPNPVQDYLLRLRLKHNHRDDPTIRLQFAKSLASVGLYRPAFDEARRELERDPSNEAALSFGGELIVHHRLGILRYEGDEYLSGFSDPEPSGDDITIEDIVAGARRLQAGSQLSTLHTALGFALFREGKGLEAARAFDLAVQLDPANQVARENLEQVITILRR